eukprot:jgi/Bigna1/136674/aug1.35_g11382
MAAAASSEEKESDLIAAEHQVWKENVPYLYQTLCTKRLERPSASVEWMPSPYSTDGDRLLLVGSNPESKDGDDEEGRENSSIVVLSPPSLQPEGNGGIEEKYDEREEDRKGRIEGLSSTIAMKRGGGVLIAAKTEFADLKVFKVGKRRMGGGGRGGVKTTASSSSQASSSTLEEVITECANEGR